jgi:hypothetical protein
VLVHDELPLAASAAVNVVVVDEFHSMEAIAKIKTNKRKNLPKIKSKSMMDSRFMGQSYTTKYFPELLTANLLRATYRRASQAWL